MRCEGVKCEGAGKEGEVRLGQGETLSLLRATRSHLLRHGELVPALLLAGLRLLRLW